MSNPRNRRILVIDDNPAIHEDFQKILSPRESSTASLEEKEKLLFGDPPSASKLGRFEIDCASQGPEGLALVEQARREGSPFTVAFVDVRMPPGWDGIETIEWIWQADPDIQTVICTAYSDYSAADIIHRLGISDRLQILRKPCDYSEVLMTATALNEKWQRLQAIQTAVRQGSENG
jgi:CheY-like chemotaxis protein